MRIKGIDAQIKLYKYNTVYRIIFIDSVAL